jgi:hypothetical protein
MSLYNTRAPALPTAPADYNQKQQDQFAYALRLYFNQLDGFLGASSTVQSGTTTNRPTQFLQVGQFYFDTTLGYPIWYNGTAWVNASGTAV